MIMDDFNDINGADIRFKIIQKEQEKLAQRFMNEKEACLYCGHDDIEENDLEFYEVGVRTTVFRCPECEKAWTAYYGLLGIETEESRKEAEKLMPSPDAV